MSRGAKSLTELEGAALAVVRREGECTAYRVKKAFEDSPSDFWSGSAGAVYPLVARLTERGLLKAGRPGDRGDRALTLTDRGRTAVAAWLRDAEAATSPGFDPLRTRLHFAQALPPAARRRFVADLEAKLKAQLDDPPAPPGEDAERARALYRLWIEARLGWLKEARKQNLI